MQQDKNIKPTDKQHINKKQNNCNNLRKINCYI